MIEEKIDENSKEEDKPRIDPDLSWKNEQNKDAARSLGLKYDPKSRVYRDSGGCPTLDRYGQDLG